MAIVRNVKVRQGKWVVDFSEERLKSDLALSTQMGPQTIDNIVQTVYVKLSKLSQPIKPWDISSSTHYTLVEMGLRDEAEKYLGFVNNRYEQTWVPKDKIMYIPCEYCGTSNGMENKFCIGCGKALDKSKTKSKLV
jgi:hypothetical protein